MTRERSDLVARYLLGAWFLKIRLMSCRRQLWAKEVSLIHLENAALQFRKICEMIAHLSLISSGLDGKPAPKSLKGYQVGLVFKDLKDRGILNFPRRARLEKGQPEGSGRDRWTLTIDEVNIEDVSRIELIHEQVNQGLHEYSPMKSPLNFEFAKAELFQNILAMRADHMWLWERFWQHSISIEKHIFFIDLGSVDKPDRPKLVKTEGLADEEVDVDFDPDFLADFSGEIDWSEFNGGADEPTLQT